MLQDYRVLQGLAIEDIDGNIIRMIPYNGNPEGNVVANPGSICSNIANGNIYKKQTGTGNTGWVDISGNVEYTASSGVKLVDNDFQADLDAAGGLELNSNSIRINVDATNNSTEINAANELAVKGYARKSATLTAGPDIADSVAIASFNDVYWKVKIMNANLGCYSEEIHAVNLGIGTSVDYNKSSILKLGVVTKPVIDVSIVTGNMQLSITGVVGYTVSITRICQ
jgi:hypothetical protein